MDFVDSLLKELHFLILSLGQDGGLISPSVYDTAQVLRLVSSQEDSGGVLAWLLEQQKRDGGWGDPSAPLTRDVPTLASILALNMRQASKGQLQDVIEAGLRFLRRNADQWRVSLPEELPVAVELILPALLDEAIVQGLELPKEPYVLVRKLGEKRRQMIAQAPVRAATPPVHSWEVWGTTPALSLLDGSGGVGHSPATTAAWLRMTSPQENPQAYRQARNYLVDAAGATGLHIPGIVPTVWPITRFEQSFVLHMLLITGLLKHPSLRPAIQRQAANLAQALKEDGLGMSDFFMPDGDDTAAAVAVLQATGFKPGLASLQRFQNGNHFHAYRGELQPSLSLTARAAHSLTLFGENGRQSETFIIERQLADGRWPGDKWNSSWLYTTYFAALALASFTRFSALQATAGALLAHQHEDGGWGQNGRSTAVETAFGALTLHTLFTCQLLNEQTLNALHRAFRWLCDQYTATPHLSDHKYWLGKELYQPYRIDRTIELSAILVLACDNNLNG